MGYPQTQPLTLRESDWEIVRSQKPSVSRRCPKFKRVLNDDFHHFLAKMRCLFFVSKLWYWFDRGSLQVQVNFQRPLIAFLCCMYQTCSYFGKLRRMFSWVFRITWPLICLIFRRQCSAVSSWPVIGPSEAPVSQSWLWAGSDERLLKTLRSQGRASVRSWPLQS